MKRGQLLGLPLLLLFALIVGGLILLYGIHYILELQDEAAYVSVLQEIKDLDAELQVFAHYDVGSSRKYTLDLPQAVETVCFYDPSQSFSCQDDGKACSASLLSTLDLVLQDSSTFYLIPPGVYDQTRFSLNDFRPIDGNPVCLSNGKSFQLVSFDGYVGVQYDEE